MKDVKLWLYGSVPDPTGGVSVFLSRLIEHSRDIIGGLVDPYYAARKIAIPIAHWQAKRGGMIEKAKVMSFLLRLRHSPVFINGSRPESILAIAPFLLFRTAKSGLILHHGDLQKSVLARPWLTGMFSRALRSYHIIGCLSHLQHSFYRSLGIPENRLKLVETYLPPTNQSTFIEHSTSAIDALKWIRESDDYVFIGSGYAYPYYRHDWGLDFLTQPRGTSKCRYLLCCYGPETDHLRQLRAQFMNRNDAKLVFGLRPDEFNIILSACSAYIRPTDTDSYGMAVRDAVEHGLAIIASDACERPAGTFLHHVGDKQGFFEQLGIANSTVKEVGHAKTTCAATEKVDRISIVDFLKCIAES